MINIENLQKAKSEKQLFLLLRPQDHTGHILSFKSKRNKLFWNKQKQ